MKQNEIMREQIFIVIRNQIKAKNPPETQIRLDTMYVRIY